MQTCDSWPGLWQFKAWRPSMGFRASCSGNVLGSLPSVLFSSLFLYFLAFSYVYVVFFPSFITRKNSMHRCSGTRPFSVCRRTPRSQSPKEPRAHGAYLFLGKTKGEGSTPRVRKVSTIEASDPDKKSRLPMAVVYTFLSLHQISEVRQRWTILVVWWFSLLFCGQGKTKKIGVAL